MTVWLWLATAAGAALFLLLASGVFVAEAAPNSVGVEPADSTVAAGGVVRVDLVAEPPSQGLAAWVIEVRFDPHVVSTASRKCDPLDTPAGATGAIGCEAADSDGDGSVDVVKAFGAVIFSGSGAGLTGKVSVANITFDAVGAPGACSALNLNVVAFTGPGGKETNPSVGNGEVCIEGEASGRTPPVLTAMPTPTAEAAGGTDETGGQSAGETGGAGKTPSGASGSPDGDGRSPGASGRPPGAAATGTAGAASVPDGDSSGGFSIVPWLLAGLGVVVVGGGIWIVTRTRRKSL